jgi:hypothetical protein
MSDNNQLPTNQPTAYTYNYQNAIYNNPQRWLGKVDRPFTANKNKSSWQMNSGTTLLGDDDSWKLSRRSVVKRNDRQKNGSAKQ